MLKKVPANRRLMSIPLKVNGMKSGEELNQTTDINKQIARAKNFPIGFKRVFSNTNPSDREASALPYITGKKIPVLHRSYLQMIK